MLYYQVMLTSIKKQDNEYKIDSKGQLSKNLQTGFVVARDVFSYCNHQLIKFE